ncbi:alkaline phosphatase [Phaffia rhodozyma]|uniref:alkaline phosphatase n=1 Tax=Phaffia rhodozyma TaxID=264483 RepID=A0A0F7SJ89_PHARH|nr:alkaline phosphatase [Phaffia rhodozyma]
MVSIPGLVTLALVAASSASAQTFRRTAACPTLGCIFPPDQTDFIAGQVFDLRTEVQAPVNGSQAYKNGVPSPDFTLQISKDGGEWTEVTQAMQIADPEPKSYSFSYYEDLFMSQAKNATVVNVISKSYRHIALYEPGHYQVKLTYNDGAVTNANWNVLPLSEKGRMAKNVILFIGDGMTQSMLTAARLLGHKSINGKYQSKLQVDEAPAFGMQMTHSLDSFITDSANSATALYTGKKSTVNALNAYTDSTGTAFEDPKFETVFEMFRRIYHGQVGIVSTAYIADATPAAVVAHTSQRSQYDAIIEQFLTGVSSNYSSEWTKWDGVDVLFGGGAENFLPGAANKNISQFDRWADAGYQVVHDKTGITALDNAKRALGIVCQSSMATWLDRNVYKDNLKKFKQFNGTLGTFDLPGLEDMTLKAIDILHTRATQNGNTGWMLMSEAASIDKQMHVLDYDRALGDALELDNTVRNTIAHLKKIGIYEETLVIVTADHGHGFDVYGSADTKFLKEQKGDREKRMAVGTYLSSGLSGYQVEKAQNPQNESIVYGAQGPNFPVQWDPRYTYAGGMGAAPDHRQDFVVHSNGSRLPAVLDKDLGYVVNPADAPNGFIVNGTLPTDEPQGVHSLTDVPVYAWGPGHELFRGIQNSVDIAFKIAVALNLGQTSNVTYY